MQRRYPLAAAFVLICALCLGAVSAADGIPVGGRVLVPGGAPLAEADVRLVEVADPLAAVLAATDEPRPEPAARTVTDEAGRFRIAAPRAGLWRVRVEAPGFAPLEADLLPLIEPVELPDARLATDAGMKVRVTDPSGAPLRDALVLVRADRFRLPFLRSRWSAPLRAGRTGEDGTVRLPKGEGERVSVSASASGRAHREARGLHGTAATLKLARGVPRKLEVRSAAGEPLAGVRIAVGERPHPLGVTNGQGRLTVSLDPSAEARLRLDSDDGRRLETRLQPVAEPEDKPRTLVLPDRATVRGRLVDAESRRPVAGGVVWDPGNVLEASVTGEAGGFALGGPAGRRIEIVAGAPGYLKGDPYEFQIDGRPGPTLALRPAAAIEGRILDSDGDAIAGADVRVEAKRSPGMFRIEIGRPREMPHTPSDSRGRFRLGSLDPERSYVVRARAEGYAPAEKAVTDLEPYRTRGGVDLTLAPGQTISGVVVDEAGSAIRDASIEVRPSAPARGGRMMRAMAVRTDATPFTGATDGDGRFEIGGVPVGRFDLEARRTGFAKRTVPSIEIEEGSGTVDVGEIALEPGESVQGVVVDRDGLSVEGVEVYVRGDGPMMRFVMGPGAEAPEADAVTAPDGWFAIEDLAAGRKYTFVFRRTGFVRATAGPLELPRAEPVEVVMDPASSVSGQVLDEAGEPIAGARVDLRRSRTIETGRTLMRTMMMLGDATDGEGRFLFEDLEPGVISLEAVASGYRQAKLDGIEVPKGEDVEDVDLTLERGATVQGQVLTPDGRPAIGARVRPVVEDEDRMPGIGGAETDGDGRYRLEGLAEGQASIEATHGDYPRTVRDVELESGVNELDLTFRGGVEVSGRVTDLSGDPVVDAAVRLMPAGRMWGGPETRSESDGGFRMPGVQDGDYRVWVQAEGYSASVGEVEVSVAGEPVHGVEIQLDAGGTIAGRITGLEPEEYAGVIVRAEGSSPGGWGSGSVDYQGDYRIEHLVPGNYDVVATLPRTGRQARGQVSLEAGAGEVRLDLEFGGGLTLWGRAVQGETPVAGAAIFVEGLDVDHSNFDQTDERGEFRLEGLEAGTYRVQVRDFRSGLSHGETVEVAADREIVLRVPTGSVGGRVVDSADREPLAGVALSLEPMDQSVAGRAAIRRATTDLDGRFELANVGDGNWTLSATKQGYAALTRNLTVQSGKTADDLRLAMDATEGMTLDARLPSGAPPDDLRVAVLDPTGHTVVSGNFATGENGRVRLSSVPPGEWSLLVSAPGSATSDLRARAPGPAVPVALQPATGLRVAVPELRGSGVVATVTVRSATGQPFRSLDWSARPRSEWRMYGGQLEFASLPPGAWSVTVATADGRVWQGDSVTTPGATADLLLE